MRVLSHACLAVAAGLFAGPAAAEPTDVTVRVIAQGAKFIGGASGGARVLLHDAETGALLAEGRTSGGTGDTGRIMSEAHGRNRVLSSDGAAGVTLTIDIERATKVRLTADAPLHQPQAALRATAERWVLPGKDVIQGDGWLVELPGLAVDVDAPGYWDGSVRGAPVTIMAHVTMLCGCGISPAGLWSSEDIDIEAAVTRDGDEVARAPLAHSGTVSRFVGAFEPDGPGVYEIEVRAFHMSTGAAGVDRTAVVVH